MVKNSAKAEKTLRLEQIKQVYSIAKAQDSKLPLWLALVFFSIFALAAAIGIAIQNLPSALIIGIPLGILACMFLLGRKAERGAYAQIEGKPGASGAVFSNLKRGWITEETPVAVGARTKNLVFRAVGRPGVILISEGPAGRAQRLLNTEKLKVNRIVPSVPVHMIQTGHGKDQIPIQDAAKKIMKLKNQLTAAEVTAVSSRLSSLNRSSQQIPKGINRNKVRPNRRMMR